MFLDLAMAVLLAAPALAQQPAVQLWTDGPGLYHVEGSFEAAAAPSVAWGVITDYNDIGRFVGSVLSSRVVRRGDGALIVEQTGRGKLWMFHKTITMKLVVVETPPHDVDFEALGSTDFDAYDGSWRIEPDGAGCKVVYKLTAKPGPSLGPRFAARRALEKNVAAQLEDVRREIERRAREGAP